MEITVGRLLSKEEKSLFILGILPNRNPYRYLVLCQSSDTQIDPSLLYFACKINNDLIPAWTGPKGFSLSSYGSEASTVEPFLVDEKKITAKHVVFWVEKRLAAQGIIPVWKD